MKAISPRRANAFGSQLDKHGVKLTPEIEELTRSMEGLSIPFYLKLVEKALRGEVIRADEINHVPHGIRELVAKAQIVRSQLVH